MLKKHCIDRHAEYYSTLYRQEVQHPEEPSGLLQRELDNLIIGSQRAAPDIASLCCLAVLQILQATGPVSLALLVSKQFLSRSDLSAELTEAIQNSGVFG